MSTHKNHAKKPDDGKIKGALLTIILTEKCRIVHLLQMYGLSIRLFTNGLEN